MKTDSMWPGQKLETRFMDIRYVKKSHKNLVFWEGLGRYKIDVDILIKVQRGSDAGPRHEYECVLDLHYLSNEMLVSQWNSDTTAGEVMLDFLIRVFFSLSTEIIWQYTLYELKYVVFGKRRFVICQDLIISDDSIHSHSSPLQNIPCPSW